METRRIKKALQWRARLNNHKRNKPKCTQANKNVDENIDYGPNCQKPDMEEVFFKEETSTFLKKLEKSMEEKEQFEKETILQCDSSKWLEERRKLLTSSNFYKVCSKRPDTSCRRLVKELLYDRKLTSIELIAHGKRYEQTALHTLGIQENLTIENCGMFIGSPPYLAATPDGIVGKNLLVEVKCPSSAFNMHPDDAIKNKKITFWKFNAADSTFSINKNNPWYYQIQGQLNVSGKKTCVFGVWTGHNYEMKVARVERDKNYWATCMKPKLIQFYLHCILPESIDPRHTRNMLIREPNYILEAQKLKSASAKRLSTNKLKTKKKKKFNK